ncbi:MAG: nucleotidyltransferase domain-containing protein [Actinobacteria bacterium]|nr:nucleotidyltransferase domain-containing protein [Actinomycetota bacterium]
MPSEQRIADIGRKHEVRFLALFGSRALGVEKARDTDIAVSFGRPISAREELSFFYEMVRLFATDKLDVVVLDKADPILLKEVAVYGKPLYEQHPGVFGEFIMSAIAKYQDTKENRRIANELVDEFLREHKRGA